MKLLRDPLGRAIPRLFFKLEELDEQCQQIVADFMDRHSGGFRLPLPTDDIIRMIENETDDLDMYADLPEELDGYIPAHSSFRTARRGCGSHGTSRPLQSSVFAEWS
jgi:hypothetical protein